MTRPLTPGTEDYLKAIWSDGEWDDEPLTTSTLATRMGHAVSTTSDTVRKLTEQGLVEHPRYGAITLTEQGRRAAVAVVRRHRLLETFLVSMLGYGWDEVHDEAEVLEHAVSDLLVERLDRALGHPERDPHGDPIPRPDGTVRRPEAVTLDTAEVGLPAVVVRVADHSATVLRYLADAGVELDAEVCVTDRRPDVGVLTVEVGAAPVVLGLPAASAVWVTPR